MDAFRVTVDQSCRRAVTIEPLRLMTTSGVGSIGVDNFPLLR